MTYAVFGVVFLAALPQRITGMGFGLMAGPLLVLLMGAHTGVFVVNVCGAMAAAYTLTRLRADVDWAVYRMVALPAVLGTATGVWVASLLSGAVLSIAAGVLALAALSAGVAPRLHIRDAWIGPVGRMAGYASGVLGGVAGLAGPVINAYALATKVEIVTLRATLQPFFLTTALTSVCLKATLTTSELTFRSEDLAVVFLAFVTGLGAGELLATRMPASLVKTGLVVLSFLGAGAAITNGLMGLTT